MNSPVPPAPMIERERRISRLVEAASELRPAERDLFFARVCGDDRELRGEVQRRLQMRSGEDGQRTGERTEEWPRSGGPAPRAAEAQAKDDQGDDQGHRLDVDPSADRSTDQIHTPLRDAPSRRNGTPIPPGRGPPQSVLGERVHNYEVVSKIGQGGMGVVYLARHLFFERTAALKVLHPHLHPQLESDSNLVGRFMNEARAANAIRHPNIIEVVDTGFLPSTGSPYLLMEHLLGESLGARLRRERRLSVEIALQIAGQTASALSAAHDQGIVHRDLKPENLFLVPRPGSIELVKVLDFGIAKLRLDLAGHTVNTLPGTLVGTPRYMSPEQCRGTGTIDHRADIYALGIILYEMLTGVPPFQSEGVGHLLSIQMSEAPAPLRTHLPEIPPYIEDAVLRALNKRPEDRFQSMRELRAALGPAALIPLTPPTGSIAAHDFSAAPSQSSIPAVAARDGQERTLSGARRSRFWALALVAVLVLGAGTVSLWKRRGNQPGSALDKGSGRLPSPESEPAAPPERAAEAATPNLMGSEKTASTAAPSSSGRDEKKVTVTSGNKKRRSKPSLTSSGRSTKSAAPQPESPAPPPKKFVPLW
jgi:serine/threonine protein kinase